jgi:hypothetical protein
VLQSVDSFDLASDVVLAGGSKEVLDGGMCLIITAENLLGLEHPVVRTVSISATMEEISLEAKRLLLIGLVDIVNSKNRKIAIVSQVTQSYA